MRATLDDYALIASLIRTLLTQSPDLMMYHPRRPIWGWVAVGTTDVALHLEGCLANLMSLQSGVIAPDLELDAGSLARALQAELRLKVINDALLISVTLQERSHGPCVLVDGSRLPWRPSLVTPTASSDQPLRLPAGAELPRQRINAMLLNPLMNLGACSSLQEFMTVIGTDPEIDLLPEPSRSERLKQWIERHLVMERSRLGMLQVPIPAWMQGPVAPAPVSPARPARRL
jgi:hypothetical protein